MRGALSLALGHAEGCADRLAGFGLRAANDLLGELLITVKRHGRTIHFPDVPGGTEVPYTYRDLETGGWYEERFAWGRRPLAEAGLSG